MFLIFEIVINILLVGWLIYSIFYFIKNLITTRKEFEEMYSSFIIYLEGQIKIIDAYKTTIKDAKEVLSKVEDSQFKQIYMLLFESEEKTLRELESELIIDYNAYIHKRRKVSCKTSKKRFQKRAK